MAEVVKRDIDPARYDKDFLLRLYREMVKQRAFDENLIRLLHEGKVSGFYHSGIGQEATGAGTCASLRDDDYILYDHRGCNQMIAKGVPLDKIYGDFMGRLCGTTCGLGAGIVHVAYPEKGVLGQSGTLGACFVIAAGAGYAVKVKKTDQVCVCYFGDGTAARDVAKTMSSAGTQPLGDGKYHSGEIRWIIRNERVTRLADIILRRTLLPFEDGISAGVVDAIAAIAAEELGWTDERRRAEIEHTSGMLSGRYRVRTLTPTSSAPPERN